MPQCLLLAVLTQGRPGNTESCGMTYMYLNVWRRGTFLLFEAKDQETIELQQQVKSKKQGASIATGEKFQLITLTQKQAPFKMSRGSVAVEGNKAYFRSGVS